MPSTIDAIVFAEYAAANIAVHPFAFSAINSTVRSRVQKKALADGNHVRLMPGWAADVTELDRKAKRVPCMLIDVSKDLLVGASFIDSSQNQSFLLL